MRLLAADDHDQEAALLTVDGEIDLDSAPILRTVLLAVLERHNTPVIVDLSTVAFMDSTGVHVSLPAGGSSHSTAGSRSSAAGAAMSTGFSPWSDCLTRWPCTTHSHAP